MKTNLLIILLITASACRISAQEEHQEKIVEIIEAIYDSKTELGYRFIERIEQTPIIFKQIKPRLLQYYNLQDDSLIGTSFRIKYGTEKSFTNVKDTLNTIPYREQHIILDLQLIE